MKTLRILSIIALLNFILITGVILYKSFTSSKDSLSSQELLDSESAISDTPSATITPSSATVAAKTVSIKTPTPTPIRKVASNRCIIIIEGAKYDVTALRKTHTGGDVFVCGTDMTATFFSHHNQSFLENQVAPYKVNK